MAIALTAAAVVGSGIARTSTPSYTVGAGSTLLVAIISSTVQPSAVSYGGNAMTLASKENTSTSQWTTLAYLLSPPTGANNFSFTISAGSITVCAADYSGVASADGSAVTNFTAAASLTTNVTLAGSGEWVVAAGISGHLTNVFQTTANLTVETQSNSFLTCALMDTAGAVGGGTIGFVTTINGSSFSQAVVCQAFAPSATGNNGSLAVTFADFTLAGAGSAAAHGALSETFADFALAGAGSAAAHGALSETFADFALAGHGTSGGSNNGSLAVTFSDFTLAGASSAAAHGALSEAFSDFTLAGHGGNGQDDPYFYPQDPSRRSPKIVKPYSGSVGDAFGGVPGSSGGYPPYNAALAMGPGIGRPPTLPPVQQHALVIAPR